MPKKLAITGSIKWDDKIKVKDTIYELKKKLKENLRIYSGGMKQGADYYIKKFCSEFEIQHYEVPPYNYQWNPSCIDPPYMYNKPFKPSHVFMRNEKYSQECDILIVFKTSDDDSPSIIDLMDKFSKKDKKILVIN